MRKIPTRRAPPSESATPIVLIPGFCSPAEVLRPLGRRLERRFGRPSRVLSLGMPWGDIRDLAEHAHALLAADAKRFGSPGPDGGIDVVGHSMGGLVAAYVLKCLDQGRRIRRVVTLGTPHRGLPIARVGRVLPGPIGRTLRQLSPNSSLLGLLGRLVLPPACELISVAGLDDGVVPRGATRLPERKRHRNLEVSGIDHLGLVFSRRGFDAVADLLRPDPPDLADSRQAASRAV